MVAAPPSTGRADAHPGAAGTGPVAAVSPLCAAFREGGGVNTHRGRRFQGVFFLHVEDATEKAAGKMLT